MLGDSNFTGSKMLGFIFSKLNWTGFILEWSSLKVDLLLTAQSSLFSTRPWCIASVHPPSQTSSIGTKGCATEMSSSSLNWSYKPGWIHAFMFTSDPDSRIYNLLSSNCISLCELQPQFPVLGWRCPATWVICSKIQHVVHSQMLFCRTWV